MAPGIPAIEVGCKGKRVIDEIDRQLETWVKSLLKGASVAFSPPPADAEGSGVAFHLTELRHAQPTRGGRDSHLEMAARYMVTVWAQNPLEEHRMLAELAFAAMRDQRFELELEPPVVEFWSAMGCRPRAAFHLRIPVRLELDRPKAKPILEPIRLRHTKLGPWLGRVLGPGDIALAGAQVEFPQLGLAATTDPNGRFRLAGVPLEAPPSEVRVHAKGREFLVPASEWGDEDGTVTIRLSKLEV